MNTIGDCVRANASATWRQEDGFPCPDLVRVVDCAFEFGTLVEDSTVRLVW